MKHSIIFTGIITLALSSQLVSAGSITDTYATGDTLTATKMDNIKAAVNDNDTNIGANATGISANATSIGTKQNRVASTCPTGQSIRVINANGTVTCEVDSSYTDSNAVSAVSTAVKADKSLIPGLLIDSFVVNGSASLSEITGYYNISTNYVPPVNATAHVFARCTLDSSTAGKKYTFRVARRTPTGTGTPATGNSFYLDTGMAAANVSVMQINNDFFNLTAKESYDFGVYFSSTTPITGTGIDYCTLTVMIFSR